MRRTSAREDTFNLDKEIPHGTAVEIIYLKRDDGVVEINATVYCEKKVTRV